MSPVRMWTGSVISPSTNVTKDNFHLAKVWFVDFRKADLSATNFEMADGLRTARLYADNTAGSREGKQPHWRDGVDGLRLGRHSVSEAPLTRGLFFFA